MKTRNTALANLVFSGNFVCFDLYVITLAGGGVLRFTTADFPISITNWTWTTKPPVDTMRSKAQAHWKVGLDVDTWLVVLLPRPFDPVSGAAFPDMIGNVPWIQAAQGGALDFADFKVRRAFFSAMPTHPIPAAGVTPVGTMDIFSGLVAEVDTSDSLVAITANDYRVLMQYPMPRNFFQASCRFTLFGAGCGLNAATYTNIGAAQAGSTQGAVVTSLGVPGGSGTYALGSITFTSGLNAGFSRTITGWTTGRTDTLSLLNPLPFTVEAGDSFTVTPGCDKTLGGGCTQFGNTPNFGGQPFIPIPETSA